MITFKRFYFVLFFCFSSVLGLAQSTNSANKEAKELLNKAGQSFLKLDSKKSLDFAQRALILATKNNDDLLASKAYNLIGLNFDRVWEGTMSDIYYSPEICRNIMVDARYILFIIDKFAGAQNIIDELKIIYPKSKK